MLESMSQNPAAALDLGKAAEHLVCADIILSGHRCFLSDQGLPYDLVLDSDGWLVRVQVKAACFPRNVNFAGRNVRMAYSWSVRRRGKGGGGERLDTRHCDLIALVALDIRTIAYMPVSEVGSTCQLMPPGHEFRGQFRRSRYADVSGFPLADALATLTSSRSVSTGA